MSLNYLNFDYAEDTEGVGTLEAMASTWPHQVLAVQAEIARVLGWCYATLRQRGPLEEGGDWDYDLQGMHEFTTPETIQYDEATRQLSVQVGPAGRPRHTVTVAITGSSEFCSEFRRHFALDDSV